MKLFPAFLSLLFACVPAQPSPHHPTNEEAAPSVYEIDVDVAVDIRQMKEVMSAAGFDTSEAPDVGHKKWLGTAWILAHRGDTTFVITAGHICETSKSYHSDVFGDMPILDRSYTVSSADGRTVQPAFVMEDDDEIDLCIMSVEGNLGAPIQLATSDPKYGAEIEYIGAPAGLWGGGIAPIFKGLFSGRGKIWGDGKDSLTVSVTSAGGASGSPVLYGGYAIGLFTANGHDFHDLGTAVPWDTIMKFEKKVLGD